MLRYDRFWLEEATPVKEAEPEEAYKEPAKEAKPLDAMLLRCVSNKIKFSRLTD